MSGPVTVLCVGGSDSSAGAGIQADLKTVCACGGYALTVITSLTAQNTRGVQDILPVAPKFIEAQLDVVLSDIGADALKTGMLLTAGAVGAVAKKIRQYDLKNVVIDPVMVAKGGRHLMQDGARLAMIKKLLPQATVITPNIPEAEFLSNMQIRSLADMKKAAVIIRETGVQNVVIKGGHLPGSRKSGSVDILYDGKGFMEYHTDWIDTVDTHGTGCTFASALATYLAQGNSIVQSVRKAKKTVTRAIEQSLKLGHGQGPVRV